MSMLRSPTQSIIGQILFYAFARPVISRLSPDVKLTAARVDLIANHITEFSLAYLREARSRRGTRTKVDGKKK